VVVISLSFLLLPLRELLLPLGLVRSGGIFYLVIEVLFFRFQGILFRCPLVIE
jgi:hypothetical protein